MKKWMAVGLMMAIGLTARATVIVSNDFSSGQGDWARRGNPVTLIAFTNGAVNITPMANGQPCAAYLSFSPVTLQDGDMLRMTVDVSSATVVSGAKLIRSGFGFADPLITGDAVSSSVPMRGYTCSLPSAGNATDPAVTWINTGAPVNFFNTATANIGNMSLVNTVSVGSTPKTWVFEATRSGNDIIFSGSLGGTAFGSTATATGGNVISNFQFNTVGLAAYVDQTAPVIYDNVKIELVAGTPPPPMPELPISDDFSGGQGTWATRLLSGAFVTNGAMSITPTGQGQPNTAYLEFVPVTLADGDVLRLSADVSVTVTNAKDREIRMGLGFAASTISSSDSARVVPLDGYVITAPINGSTADSRIFWNDYTGTDINFFNSGVPVGDTLLDDNYSVTSNAVTWVVEIARSGTNLVFLGSLGGKVYDSTVTARGASVISNFTFNTIGLGYAYTVGQTGIFDNVTAEVLVGAYVSPYAAWSNAYNLTQGPYGNDDGDALNNLYEFGLGGDPTNALDVGYTPLSSPVGIDGTNWFYYVYPRMVAANGILQYSIETTEDLINVPWTNGNYEVVGTGVDGFAAGFNAVTNRIPTDVKNKQFIQLLITELP